MAKISAVLAAWTEEKYYYRDKYRLCMRLIMVQAIVMLALSAVLIYLWLRQGNPVYYATANNGNLVRLQPLAVVPTPHQAQETGSQ